MNQLTNFDRFLIYLILPFIGIYSLLAHRYYEKREKHRTQSEKISKDLIIGNFITLALGITAIGGLYIYLINFSVFSQYIWEIITILILSILSSICAVGIGAHVAAVTIEKKINKQDKDLRDIVHYFHFPFAHYLMIPPIVLASYTLSVFDLFKGKIIALNQWQVSILVFSALCMALVITFIIIYHRMDKTMTITSGVLTTTIITLILEETRVLRHHPIALFLISTIIAIFITLLLFNLSPHKIRSYIKSITQKWLDKPIARKPNI